MVNSCLGPFTAASSRWHPFSRSYGVILPSSLERVISRPSVSSTHPPVSVSGTGDNLHRLRAFLGTTLHHAESVDPSQSIQGVASSRASLLSSSCQSGIINPVSIDYACRPRLRSRLTPPRTSLPGEPLGFRGIGFSPMFALLKPTFSLPPRPRLLTLPLHPSAERSPTIHIHNFGASLSPVHFRRKGA